MGEITKIALRTLHELTPQLSEKSLPEIQRLGRERMFNQLFAELADKEKYDFSETEIERIKVEWSAAKARLAATTKTNGAAE
jgi:hypothetical protein